jgi:hypothetical protein
MHYVTNCFHDYSFPFITLYNDLYRKDTLQKPTRKARLSGTLKLYTKKLPR